MRLRRHDRLLRSAVYNAHLAPALSPRSHRRRQYTSSSSDEKDIAIIGGGITGLATAHYLNKELPSAKITLYEASERVGGWLHSKRVEVPNGRILFESGPRTLRFSLLAPAGMVTARLIQDLGLIDDVLYTFSNSAAHRNRYVYYPDHLVKMPHPSQGIFNIVKRVLSEPFFRGVPSGVLKESFQDERPSNVTDESVGSFITRRLGKPLADKAASAVLHGIYAGDIYQLSARSLFPLQWHLEGKHGSVLRGLFVDPGPVPIQKRDMDLIKDQNPQELEPQFSKNLMRCSVYSFKNGIQQLVDRLTERLRQNRNVTFSPSTAIKTIEKDTSTGGIKLTTASRPASPTTHTHAISTLYSRTLSTLCPRSPTNEPKPSPASVPHTLLPSLAQTHAVTVMVVNLYFANPDVLPVNGFGYLLPRAVPFAQNPEFALGVVFDSDAIVGQDELSSGERGRLGTKVTVMMGGHWWDGWTAFPSAEEGVAMARTVLARHLRVVEAPAATNVSLQKECIPQYTVGHYERMGRAHEELKEAFGGRLRVVGNSYTGVGVNDCVRAARDLAKGFAEEVSWTTRTGLEQFSEGEVWVRGPVVRKKKPEDDEG